MPTRNINLTPEMDGFVATRIESGNYANASEVVRAGLRALEKDEREDAAKIAALKQAIRAGEASGIARGDVIARMRLRLHRRAEATGVLEGRGPARSRNWPRPTSRPSSITPLIPGEPHKPKHTWRDSRSASAALPRRPDWAEGATSYIPALNGWSTASTLCSSARRGPGFASCAFSTSG